MAKGNTNEARRLEKYLLSEKNLYLKYMKNYEYKEIGKWQKSSRNLIL